MIQVINGVRVKFPSKELANKKGKLVYDVTIENCHIGD